MDDGQPPRSSSITLNIIVQKVPLPQFKQNNYTAAASENDPANTFIVKVDASVPNLVRKLFLISSFTCQRQKYLDE